MEAPGAARAGYVNQATATQYARPQAGKERTTVANPARDKGTMAETGLVKYLNSTYWPNAERRRLSGTLDKGDVSGTPGLCWECKYAGGAVSWWSWMAEARVERINANADLEVLVVKPKGVGFTDVGSWYAAMSDTSWRYLTADMEQREQRLHITEPMLYRLGTFRVFLQSVDLWRAMEMEPHVDRPTFCAVTMYKPGDRELPGSHIKVTYLRQMVELLHEGGY